MHNILATEIPHKLFSGSDHSERIATPERYSIETLRQTDVKLTFDLLDFKIALSLILMQDYYVSSLNLLCAVIVIEITWTQQSNQWTDRQINCIKYCN